MTAVEWTAGMKFVVATFEIGTEKTEAVDWKTAGRKSAGAAIGLKVASLV